MPCVRAAGVTILMRRVSGCSGFPAAFLFTHSPFSLNHSLRQPGEPHAGRKSEIVLKAMISLLPALYQRVLLPHQGVPPRGKIPLVGFPASYTAGCKSDFFIFRISQRSFVPEGLLFNQRFQPFPSMKTTKKACPPKTLWGYLGV